MRNINDYAEKYYNEPGELYQVKYRKKLVLEKLAQYKHSNILEIGCGLDPLFQYIKEYERMTIVEPAKEFADHARKLAKEAKNITIIDGFFEDKVSNNEIEKCDYDYVVLSSLLHELEAPEEILKAIYQICNTKTVVHINVPNAFSIHRLLAKEMGIISDEHELSFQQINMQRHHVFDQKSLIHLLEANGFEIIESGTYFLKFLTGEQMDNAITKGIVTEDIYEGLYRIIKYIPQFGSEIYVQVRKA